MRLLSAGTAFATVLLLHTGAFAQQTGEAPRTQGGPAEAAPAPDAAAPSAQPGPPTAGPYPPPPPPYGPPPGYTPPAYGYGPQGYGYGPPAGPYPQRYYAQPHYGYPPPSPRGLTYRPFMIGIGLGLGPLAVDDEIGKDSWTGVSYAVRLGFGLSRRWIAQLSFEGLSASTEVVDLTHQVFLIGAQAFVTDWLYVRGGLGFARLSFEDNGFLLDETNDGRALHAGVGVELVQGRFASLALEWAGTASRFSESRDMPAATWFANGFNFVLSFY